ncbi:MAG: leucyl/phenylalanyl-tRNA--protein transferase [Gammaproteobacteria bacterium]|nr:leucyl/phenylalanyl-tRNA--protein transferase [Gammaproteobacteria bacterium]
MTGPYLLDINNKKSFPDVTLALREPDGLLAIGGDLTIERLVAAYRNGIFPWYSEGQPILWWSPDPRMVLKPSDIKISRSLAKTIRKHKFQITMDQNFEKVILSCSQPRLEKGSLQTETWILDDMINAYKNMHQSGYAHSVECWQDNQLVGGLYGIALGKVFFGESMFSKVSDASKTAFVFLSKQLERWGYKLIDCQVYTSHLECLGATMISREKFIALLNQHARDDTSHEKWLIEPDLSSHIISSMEK